MLIRISLIAAILAGLAVTSLNFWVLKQKVTRLQADLTAQTAARQQAEAESASAKAALATRTATLKETRTALEASTAEQQKAIALATAETRRADKLGRELAQTRQALEEAQAGLARYQAAGMEPDQILQAAKQLKGLQDSLAAARQTNAVLGQRVKQLEEILGPEGGQPVILPAGLRAKVLAADPKWHFLVLDAGEKQGVLVRGEVLVSRQGKLVAKARISRVEENSCVANLLPGWELGEVMEGDVAMAAGR